ncbi:MAG TPA: toxin HicA [Corynebacterium flavescens]|uniref:Toxin HicA n=1 Tax=Corynebacterium flavescens TaxID=28028 RepID=A0A1L7CPH4_CORFL|nr:toxin HicA [Corynebacterium flavescens]KAA8720143.1 toxin HicA [Corynebacterium flavescens]HCG46870.1 toxin HicA [Corynebacterium flavescens]
MVKRKDILKNIASYAKRTGQTLTLKEGRNHTRIWVGDRYTTVGRHNEIDDLMARKIYKQIGMEK